ncbi:MAG TPA: aminodeoxychorismate synthase component I [Pyrinomonadaceae bacterium]|nr:aminodeoxychorismate synthase component I [Pyrinomonadaceae bacterium]
MRDLLIPANELILKLFALDPGAKLSILDSSGRTLGGSRYLIAGFEPAESFEFNCRTQAEAFEVLEFLDEKLKFYQAGNKPTSFPLQFEGACIATLSYDLGRLFENLSLHQEHESGEPSACLYFYDTLVVHDYQTGKTFIRGKREDEFAGILKTQNFLIEKPLPAVSVTSNFEKSEYLAAIERIREHIARGDIYQANLTQQLRVEAENALSPERVFLHLRENHPAPFAAFIRRESDVVVSASPERFIKVLNSNPCSQNHRTVIAQPIKGTRPRGKTEAVDEQLRRELKTSEKDRAENVMIVDLLRNDIGRVCEFGSVAVEKLCELEEHPTLFHLVSTIRGKLKEETTVSDLLKAAFPCGSITGAPKIRAMQILDAIETTPRGLSTGAIGYFGFDGSIDLSVAIRTAVIRENIATFNVGGGITFDSNPEEEYAESLLKARALLNAFCGNYSG